MALDPVLKARWLKRLGVALTDRELADEVVAFVEADDTKLDTFPAVGGANALVDAGTPASIMFKMTGNPADASTFSVTFGSLQYTFTWKNAPTDPQHVQITNGDNTAMALAATTAIDTVIPQLGIANSSAIGYFFVADKDAVAAGKTLAMALGTSTQPSVRQDNNDERAATTTRYGVYAKTRAVTAAEVTAGEMLFASTLASSAFVDVQVLTSGDESPTLYDGAPVTVATANGRVIYTLPVTGTNHNLSAGDRVKLIAFGPLP